MRRASADLRIPAGTAGLLGLMLVVCLAPEAEGQTLRQGNVVLEQAQASPDVFGIGIVVRFDLEISEGVKNQPNYVVTFTLKDPVYQTSLVVVDSTAYTEGQTSFTVTCDGFGAAYVDTDDLQMEALKIGDEVVEIEDPSFAPPVTCDLIRPFVEAWGSVTPTTLAIGTPVSIAVTFNEPVTTSNLTLKVKSGTGDDTTFVGLNQVLQRTQTWSMVLRTGTLGPGSSTLEAFGSSGTYADSVGNAPGASFPAPLDWETWSRLRIDTVRPKLSSWGDVTPTTLAIGTPVSIPVTFSEPVTTNSLTLKVKSGTGDDTTFVGLNQVLQRTQTWSMVLGTGTLGPGSSTLEAFGSSGTYADSVGNAPGASFPAPLGWETWTRLRIDTVRPKLSSWGDVTPTTLAIGTPVSIDVNFSEPVTTNNLTLKVKSGTGHDTTFVGLNQVLQVRQTWSMVLGTGTLGPGSSTLEAYGSTGTYVDSVQNVPAASFPAPLEWETWTNLTIDTAYPRLASAKGTDSSNTWYGPYRGGTIDITFDEDVKVTDVVKIKLDTNTYTADYSSSTLKRTHRLDHPKQDPSHEGEVKTSSCNHPDYVVDKVGNPTQNSIWQNVLIQDFKMDETHPSVSGLSKRHGSGAWGDLDDATLAAGPAANEREYEIRIEATDEGGAGLDWQSADVDWKRPTGGWEDWWSDSQNRSQNVWNLDSHETTKYQATATVKDYAQNPPQATPDIEFYVDNPRVLVYSLDIEDPYGQITNVIPAGYPVDCRVGMQNSGSRDIPSLTGATIWHWEGLDSTSIGEDHSFPTLSANGVAQVRGTTLLVPPTTTPSPVTVRVWHDHPQYGHYRETKPGDFEYSVASSNVEFQLSFGDTAVAGSAPQISWKLKQKPNGGVAGHAKVRATSSFPFGAGPPEWPDHGMVPEALLPGQSTGSIPGPTQYRESLTTDDGTLRVLRREMFEVATDQSGGTFRGHDGGRVDVRLLTGSQDGGLDTIRIVNSVLSTVLTYADSTGSDIGESITLPTRIGDEVDTLYFCLKNAKPWFVPSADIEVIVPNDPRFTGPAAQAGWEPVQGSAPPRFRYGGIDSLLGRSRAIPLPFKAATSEQLVDNVTFEWKTDRCSTSLTRNLEIQYATCPTTTRWLCRVEPTGDSIEADSYMKYALKLGGEVGETRFRFKISDALNLSAVPGEPDSCAYYYNSIWNPFARDGDYLVSQWLQVPGGTPAEYLLRFWVVARASNGSDAGISYTAPEVECAPGFWLRTERAPGCVVDQAKAKVKNVMLRLSASLKEGLHQVQAGTDFAIVLTLENKGDKDLAESDLNSFTLASDPSPFIPGLTSKSLPVFDLTEGLTARGSIDSDWLVHAADTIAAKSGTTARKLFVGPSTFPNWELCYYPFYFPCRDLDRSHFLETNYIVDITSPLLEAKTTTNAVRTPTGWEIPSQSDLVFTHTVENTGNQPGTVDLKYPRSALPAGLQTATGQWPRDALGVVVAPDSMEEVSDIFFVSAQRDTYVYFLDKVQLESRYRNSTVEFGYPDSIKVIDPVISLSWTDSPTTHPAKEPIEWNCRIRNNSRETQALQLFFQKPTISWAEWAATPPDDAVSLKAITVIIGGEPPRTCRAFSQDPEDALVFDDVLPTLGPGQEGTLTVQMATDYRVPSNTSVARGTLSVSWGVSGVRATARAVGASVIMGCRVKPAGVIASPSLVNAGEILSYEFSAVNDAQAIGTPRERTLALHVRRPAGLEWSNGDARAESLFVFSSQPLPPGEFRKAIVSFRVPRNYQDSTLVPRGELEPVLAWLDHTTDLPPLEDSLFAEGAIPEVRPRNIRFSLQEVALTPAGGARADESLLLLLRLKNESGVKADSIYCQLEALRNNHPLAILTTRRATLHAGYTDSLSVTVPLGVAAFAHGDNVTFSNCQVYSPLQGQGEVPPVSNTGLLYNTSTAISNVAIKLMTRRATPDLSGSLPDSLQSDRVMSGTTVPFVFYFTNQGGIAQNGTLHLAFDIPEGCALVREESWPPEAWQPTGTSVRFAPPGGIGPAQWSDQSQVLRLGTRLPAAVVRTGGAANALTFQNLLLTSTILTLGQEYASRDDLLAGAGPYPDPVPIVHCSPESLRFVLRASSDVITPWRGERIALRLDIGFVAILEGIEGSLDIILGLVDKEHYRVVGVSASPEATAYGSVVSVWDETEVRLRSEMLRRKATAEQWYIDLQGNFGGRQDPPPQTLEEILDFDAIWRKDQSAPEPCGMRDNLTSGDGDLPGLTGAVTIDLQSAGGEYVSLYASPNPASSEMRICYDLAMGVQSLRLYISDLGGNVILTARGGVDLPMNPGQNCFVWPVSALGVPNGTYLARLEINGVGSDGRSLRATRRAKVAVLK